MKAKLKILFYIALVLFTWVVMGLASADHGRKTVKEVRVVLNQGRESFFLDADEVKKILREKNGGVLEGNSFDRIHVSELEYALRKNPWVGEADVYWKHDGSLTASVSLRKPLARLISKNGKSFYLDEKLKKFPLSPDYPADVPLITGNFSEELTPADSILHSSLAGIPAILNEIKDNEFLSSLISEVSVNSKGEMRIFPEVGDLEIIIGDSDRLSEKFELLMKFFDEVLAVTGWEKYISVDLRFDGQVVARKRYKW